MRFLVLLLGLGLGAAGAAHGATIAETLAWCRAKGSGSARLSCYDELARAVAGGVSLPALPSTGIGKWEVRRTVSPVDDSVNVTVQLLSETDAALSQWDIAVPVLTVRCQEGRTEVFLFFDTEDRHPFGYGDTATILSRFDKKKAEVHEWVLSTNRKAAFALNPRGWAHRIEQARQLFIRIDPEDRNVVNMMFDLTGSKRAMEPFRAACGSVSLPEASRAALADLGVAYTKAAFVNSAKAGHLEVVRLFVEAGMDLDAKFNFSGWTALHLAANRGHLSVVEYLVGQGADVNARTAGNGSTALHFAARYGHLSVIRYLVGQGVSVTATNNDGKTARDIAIYGGYSAVTVYLKSVGG